MSVVLDNLNSKFLNTIAAGSKMAGASTALTQMATTLSTCAAPKHNLDNGVNHRPAVQQWMAHTP